MIISRLVAFEKQSWDVKESLQRYNAEKQSIRAGTRGENERRPKLTLFRIDFFYLQPSTC